MLRAEGAGKRHQFEQVPRVLRRVSARPTRRHSSKTRSNAWFAPSQRNRRRGLPLRHAYVGA
eukprot:3701132-Rhodomonas_salina.1